MIEVKRFKTDAVLFDLDGTLIETIGDIALAANCMLEELGHPQREEDQIRQFVGKGVPNLVTRCLNEGQLEAAGPEEIAAGVAAFQRHYERVNGSRAEVYPGIFETLDALQERGLALACVTNKPEAFTHPLLAQLGLTPYFPVVVGGDSLPTRKPDPAMLQHAAQQLGARHPLMIGDSANDALAARAAGYPVLLVSYGYSEGIPVDSIECDGLLSNARAALEHIEPA